jgi:hypothetical protein
MAAETAIADGGLAGLGSAGTRGSVTAAIAQRVPGAMEAAETTIAEEELAGLGSAGSMVQVIHQLRSANAEDCTELVRLFRDNWKFIEDLLPLSCKCDGTNCPVGLLSAVCSVLRVLPPASQRKGRGKGGAEWYHTSPDPHVTAAIEAARLSVHDLGEQLASLAPGVFITPDHVLSCSCAAVLVVNSTNNVSLGTSEHARFRYHCTNWVHSPSDDGHRKYAKQLLDYATNTFRSTICPQGLNQFILAHALGVSAACFSKYLNAKISLSKVSVGKVERALDGSRGNGGSFQMQLGHMEASGKFGAAMEKHSEQVKKTPSNVNKKRRKGSSNANKKRRKVN